MGQRVVTKLVSPSVQLTTKVKQDEVDERWRSAGALRVRLVTSPGESRVKMLANKDFCEGAL